MVTSILAAILVLGLLIFVHEMGHFLAAKRLGVGVVRFSLGFGPVLFSRRIGETEYVLSAIPLGGYVKMIGEEEDGLQGGEPAAAPEGAAAETPHLREDSFAVKPAWVRATILFAGPAFNLLFAWLLYSILFATGVPVLTSAVGEVKEGMPAAAAGIVSGDEIVSVDGEAVDRWDALSAAIRASEGRALEIGVRHHGNLKTLTINATEMEGTTIFGEALPTWVIGIGPANQVITERSGPLESIGKGFFQTGKFIELTVMSIVKLFQRVVPASSLGGPIMIMKLAGDQAHEGWQALMGFMAILSINLGVLNLLPIPILDGGQLTFLGIEAVMRRPIGARPRELAQQVGMFMLISLMGFALFNDISRLVFG
ncbi:MAG: RIP metalloprotease RseP [Deltaproteobacteria bacterium]